MEIKLKFEPKDKVFVMFENRIAQGQVKEIITSTIGTSQEVLTRVKYTVSIDASKVVPKAAPGFIGGETNINLRNFDYNEDQLFATKEELIKSLIGEEPKKEG